MFQAKYKFKILEPVTIEHRESNYYDVWQCRSYSPLLCVSNTAATIPDNLNEKHGSTTVNVTAELDTGTKQVGRSTELQLF